MAQCCSKVVAFRTYSVEFVLPTFTDTGIELCQAAGSGDGEFSPASCKFSGLTGALNREFLHSITVKSTLLNTQVKAVQNQRSSGGLRGQCALL